MQVSGSNYTGNGSLPALTSCASARTSSIPSSVGSREQRREQRTLELGQDGVLQVSPPPRNSLECPFNLLYCLKDFSNGDDWVKHSLTHFVTRNRVMVGPPRRNRCCFCDAVFESHNPLESWALRMEHVQFHHHLGHRLAVARPDFELFEYLFENKLIDDATYKDLKGSSRERNAEYCDLKGIVPRPPQIVTSNMSPPVSPQSPTTPISPHNPRAAVTETYSRSRARRESDRQRASRNHG